MRKFKLAWPLAIFLLFPAFIRAEIALQAWVQRYKGLENSSAGARAVAVDGNGNVIVTGYSFSSASYADYVTIKYTSTGVSLWTNLYNASGGSDDGATAIAVDGSNNVIVTGYSTTSESYYDYATIKYSSAGVPLWTNRYNGPGNRDDQVRAVAVDGSNNVIVTGYSGPPYNYDYATIKYSSAGVPLWTNRYNGPGNGPDYAFALAVDASNNVIVTGGSVGSGAKGDYVTIKYSSAGVPLWTNLYNGPGSAADCAYAVAVDGGNNVIVTGGSPGSEGNFDYATIKYSSAGVPLWTNRYNGPGNGFDKASAVAVDGTGNVIVTGFSTNNASGSDYATIKYSSAGVPLWTNRYNGPGSGNDQANAVAVDGNGNVVVTGLSTNNASGYDFATIKYSSVGVPLWTNRYDGPRSGYDNAVGATVDHRGNVIVAGFSGESTRSGYELAVIKYVCIPMPVMNGLQLTNGTFQMRVDQVLQPGTLVIEASTDLTVWAPVSTNTVSTNVLFYTDPGAGNLSGRFFRAFQFP